MKKIIVLQALVLFPVLFTSISQASIGGMDDQYNRGSFACADQRGELEGQFTFGASQANLVIKGQAVTLECTPLRNADPVLSSVFKGQYFRPVEICVGQNAKGSVIVATSNSMGNVQMNAVQLGHNSERIAAASLNCSSAPTSNASKW